MINKSELIAALSVLGLLPKSAGIPTYNWADVPDPVTVVPGSRIYVDDFWSYEFQTNGTYWFPTGGRLKLEEDNPGSISPSVLTEEVIASFPIPAGLIKAGCSIKCVLFLEMDVAAIGAPVIRTRYGGEEFTNLTIGDAGGPSCLRMETVIHCMTANEQRAMPIDFIGGFADLGQATYLGSVDSDIAQTIELTCQLDNILDQVLFYNYSFEVSFPLV